MKIKYDREHQVVIVLPSSYSYIVYSMYMYMHIIVLLWFLNLESYEVG